MTRPDLEDRLADVAATFREGPEEGHALEDQLYLDLIRDWAPSWVFQMVREARARVERRWYA